MIPSSANYNQDNLELYRGKKRVKKLLREVKQVACARSGMTCYMRMLVNGGPK